MGRTSRTAAGHPEVCGMEEHPWVSSKWKMEGKFSLDCPGDSLGESLFVSQTCMHPKVGWWCERGFSLCLLQIQLVAADKISGWLARTLT